MAKAELRDHRKFLRLVHLLGIPAPHVRGHLEYLWSRGYQTGFPAIGDVKDVELAAEWAGTPGEFTAAAAETRFIDLIDGIYIIHDLYQHAPEYVRKRMRRNGTAPADAPNGDGQADRKPRSTKPTTTPTLWPPKNSTDEELTAALAEVTQLDPVTNERRFRKAVGTLQRGSYTAEDVREFGRNYWQYCPEARDQRQYPDVPELVRKIGRVRKAREKREAAARKQQLQREHDEAERKRLEQAAAVKQAEAVVTDDKCRAYYEKLTQEQKEELEAYILSRFDAKDRANLAEPSTAWGPMLTIRYEKMREFVITARMNH